VARRTNKNRKKEELREKRKKLVRISSFVLLFIVVGVLATFSYMKMTEINLLPIRFVKVDGEFKYLKSDKLKAILNKELNRSFFNVDIDEIQVAVKQISWVDQVTVRRSWPDTLIVDIMEQRPLARWSDGGYVNQRGEWFLAGEEIVDENWPVLNGPKGSEYFLSKEYLLMSNELEKLGLRVKAFTVNHRRSWKLDLDNGLSLQLGRLKVKTRLQRFLNVYRQVIAKQLQKIESVDMRYTNGFAVQWKTEPDMKNNKEAKSNV